MMAEVVRAIEHFDPSLVRSAVANFLLAEMTVRAREGGAHRRGRRRAVRRLRVPAQAPGRPGGLHDEIVRTIESLHNLNLQRADRVTMAHGLEARVPFLDREVIALALRLPAALEAGAARRPRRRCCCARRSRAGCPTTCCAAARSSSATARGTAKVLSEVIESRVTEEEFEAEKDQLDPPFRNKEELAYLRIFRDYLPDVNIDRTLTRFATA